MGNNPLSNIDPLGLDGQCDDQGNCKVTVSAPAPPTIIVTGWWDLAFEGWPGRGDLTTFMCMMMGGCNGGSQQSGGGSAPTIPPGPKPPAMNPPKAPPVTLTCQGSASFSDVSQSQLNYLLSQGGGALRPNIVPSTGTVAIGGSKTFGLSYSQLRQFGTYISVNPTDLAGMISNLGGPAPPYSVSDIGDINIRSSSGTRFDIYAFPNATANTFGIQNSNATTYVIPAVTGAHCPSGSQLLQGPPQ